MITSLILEGLTLNPNMIYVENTKSKGNILMRKDTLDGTPIFRFKQVSLGLPITLRAIQDQGWISYSNYLGLIELSKEFRKMILSINGIETQVIFRENDPPALDLEPLIYRITPDTNDVFIGDIKLLTA